VLAGGNPAAGGLERNFSTPTRSASASNRSSIHRSPTTPPTCLIGAMKKVNSADPAKYLPELQKNGILRRDRADRLRRQKATAATPR